MQPYAVAPPISTITLVEIVYLVEKERLPAEALGRLRRLMRQPDAPLRAIPLDMEVALTLRRVPRDDVPDMPDRIIAATALHVNLPLVTRDRKIQLSNVDTVW